ncbi:hypothetical protein HA402_015907 [Bradysia odoriphaga]|nr:hypothetical protein HA402_015907 [Bradysia odoriphaga]
MSFTGKVVLITGASSGIGAGTAEHFSQLGASLALVGRNANNLSEVIQKCGESPVLPIIADVNKDAKDIVEKTIAHFGRLDVLVNNAGVGVKSSIESTSMEPYDYIMTTNLRSVYELTIYAVPHLIATKGNIVNVSSTAGLRASTVVLTYCMSKAALDQFTKCISLELAPKGVRVNSVNPAVIRTNFHKNMGFNEEEYRLYLENCKKSHALGRVGEVSEVAEAIAFLASDSASFITGTLLPVDGGKINMCPR